MVLSILSVLRFNHVTPLMSAVKRMQIKVFESAFRIVDHFVECLCTVSPSRNPNLYTIFLAWPTYILYLS